MSFLWLELSQKQKGLDRLIALQRGISGPRRASWSWWEKLRFKDVSVFFYGSHLKWSSLSKSLVKLQKNIRVKSYTSMYITWLKSEEASKNVQFSN